MQRAWTRREAATTSSATLPGMPSGPGACNTSRHALRDLRHKTGLVHTMGGGGRGAADGVDDPNRPRALVGHHAMGQACRRHRQALEASRSGRQVGVGGGWVVCMQQMGSRSELQA